MNRTYGKNRARQSWAKPAALALLMVCVVAPRARAIDIDRNCFRASGGSAGGGRCRR